MTVNRKRNKFAKDAFLRKIYITGSSHKNALFSFTISF